MATKDSELVTTSLIKKNFPKSILETHCHRGDETVVVDRKDLLSICEFLRDDEGCSYEMLVDLTAVDLFEQNRTPRFEMVYHFKSLRHGKRIRVKVRLDEQDCSIDSIYHLWRAVDCGLCACGRSLGEQSARWRMRRRLREPSSFVIEAACLSSPKPDTLRMRAQRA